jgi:hypothetical protein
MRVDSYYAVLHVPEDADAGVIRHAYRTLVRRYHPDAGSGSSPQKFRDATEAYDKTCAQIAGECLGGERGRRLQNPVVCPAVVLVEKLNVLSVHGLGYSNPFICRILACRYPLTATQCPPCSS